MWTQRQSMSCDSSGWIAGGQSESNVCATLYPLESILWIVFHLKWHFCLKLSIKSNWTYRCRFSTIRHCPMEPSFLMATSMNDSFWQYLRRSYRWFARQHAQLVPRQHCTNATICPGLETTLLHYDWMRSREMSQILPRTKRRHVLLDAIVPLTRQLRSLLEWARPQWLLLSTVCFSVDLRQPIRAAFLLRRTFAISQCSPGDFASHLIWLRVFFKLTSLSSICVLFWTVFGLQ